MKLIADRGFRRNLGIGRCLLFVKRSFSKGIKDSFGSRTVGHVMKLNGQIRRDSVAERVRSV